MTTPCNAAARRESALALEPSRPRGDMALGAAIAGTLIFWSTAFVAISIAVAEIPPIELALARFAVASIAIGVVLLVRRRRIRIPSRGHRLGFVIMGLSVVGYQVALNMGQQTVSSGIASLLIATVPVMTAVMASMVLRERLGGRGWSGLVLALAGTVMLIVTRNHDFTINTGALFVLIAAFLGALYTVVQKRHAAEFDALELTTYSIWLATLLLLPKLSSAIEAVTHVSWQALIATIYLGIFASAVGYATWAYALTRLKASQVSSLLYLIPPLVFVEAWLIFGAMPGLKAILSGLVILGGVALVSTARRTKKPEETGNDDPRHQ